MITDLKNGSEGCKGEILSKDFMDELWIRTEWMNYDQGKFKNLNEKSVCEDLDDKL